MLLRCILEAHDVGSPLGMLCAQHCCQTPSVAVIGLQCHIHPSGRRAAPMFEVSSLKECVPSPDPEPEDPTRFVEVLVASLAKVPMMSEAKQTQSPSWSR